MYPPPSQADIDALHQEDFEWQLDELSAKLLAFQKQNILTEEQVMSLTDNLKPIVMYATLYVFPEDSRVTEITGKHER